MTHHRLIHDRQQVRDFFAEHRRHLDLPLGRKEKDKDKADTAAALQEERVCLLQLCARRKYAPQLTRSEKIFDRQMVDFAADADAEPFVRQLLRLEAPLDAYAESQTGILIPSEAFALYLTLNPASTVDAFDLASRQVQAKLVEAARGHQVGAVSPLNLFYSAVHIEVGGRFEKLDVDTKDAALVGELRALFDAHRIEPEFVIESKNGFHVVMDNKTSYGAITGRKALLEFVTTRDWLDVNGKDSHPSCVVPGTLQGGFPTRLVAWPLSAAS